MKSLTKLTLQRALLSLALIGTLGATSPALADGTAANKIIDTYHTSIKRILSGSQDTEKVRASIKAELSAIVDFPAFAELALKKYYGPLSKKDKGLYIDAFRSLIEATYVKRIKPGGDHELTFREDPEEREGKVMVFTTVAKGDNEVDIDYLLHKVADGNWKIYDIWIDEVSMARNYRSQFYKIFKENGLKGPKGLLAHMKERKTNEK